MSFQSSLMTDLVNGSGTPLPDGSELRELVSVDGDSAEFRAVLPGEATARSVAKLFQLTPQAAARQTERWRTASGILNANLLKMFHAGEAQIGGEPVSYVTVEAGDEALSGVLRERRLTPGEAREVLLSAVRGLEQLHQSGLVHGRISPGEIYAVGDAIKLSKDCAVPIGGERVAYSSPPAYVAPEGQNNTVAADIWCLGASIFETLTQSPYDAASGERWRTLPAPFDQLLGRCLNPEPGLRPSLSQILVVAELSAPEPKVQAPAAAVQPVPSPAVEAAAPEPAITQGLPLRPRTARLLLLVAIPIVVLAVALIWWAKSAPRQRTEQQATSTPAATSTGASTPASAPIARAPAAAPVTPPMAAVAPPAAAAPAPKQIEPKTVNGPVWRLVLWTFNSRSEAQHKAEQLASKYRGIRPDVFAPNRSGGPYLVIAGGEMTRKEAEEMRRRVRQLGLPRDAYIQNYSR